jgi:hypothetical protein
MLYFPFLPFFPFFPFPTQALLGPQILYSAQGNMEVDAGR